MKKRTNPWLAMIVAGVLFSSMCLMSQPAAAGAADQHASITATAAAPAMMPFLADAVPVPPVAPPTWIQSIVALLNTNSAMILFGVASASAVLWFFAKKPEWQKYEGAMISSIKFAEKFIPDDSTSPGWSKADVALKAFIKQYEEAHGKPPSDQVKAVVAAAMPVVHDALEAKGTL